MNNVNGRIPCISEIFHETVRDSDYVRKIFRIVIYIITIIILVIKPRRLVLLYTF